MWDFLKSDIIQKILLVGIIGLLCVFLFRQCEDNGALKWIAQQNQKALIDSMHIIKNKVDELSWEKTAFAANLEDMKKLNIKLYNEAIEINGKVKTLQNVDVNYIVTKVREAIVDGGQVTHNGDMDTYKYPWRESYPNGSIKSSLEGFVTIEHTRKPNDIINLKSLTINKETLELSLKTYITENEDGILVGGVSPMQVTPGLNFILETGVFDPINSKKFNIAENPSSYVIGIGPYLGAGFSNVWNPGGTAYSGFGWSLGIGFTFSYKILSF